MLGNHYLALSDCVDTPWRDQSQRTGAGRQAQVGIVGADNRVRLRKVGLGRDFGSSVEVIEGVTAADRVIVNPPDSLVEGAEVRAVQAADAAR